MYRRCMKLMNDGHGKSKYMYYYDIEWMKEDIVALELNLSKGTVSCYINDECQEIAFDNIQKNEEIKDKLAVVLNDRYDSFTIIDYSEE